MGKTFQRPLLSKPFYQFFFHFNRLILSRDVSWTVDEESLNHWKALRGLAYIIAVKHAHYTDHLSIGSLAAEIGVYPYFVSIPESFRECFGIGGMVIRRLGAFAIERGGTNISAMRFIVECLVKGEHPLIIFPEGELYFLNDVVTPLKFGTALFALEGAKARASAGRSDSGYILPIGLKYVYPYDATELLEKKLAFCEKALGMSKSKGEILSRIWKVLEEVLSRKEREYRINTMGNSLEDRFLFFAQRIVEQLEEETHGKIFEGDVSERTRLLLSFLKREKKYEREKKAHFAMSALAFLPGYLDNPSQERIMEMLRKTERLITGNEHTSFPGKKQLFVKIEKPLSVEPYVSLYREKPTRSKAIENLSEDLKQRIQEAVSSLCEKVQNSFAKAGFSETNKKQTVPL